MCDFEFVHYPSLSETRTLQGSTLCGEDSNLTTNESMVSCPRCKRILEDLRKYFKIDSELGVGIGIQIGAAIGGDGVWI